MLQDTDSITTNLVSLIRAQNKAGKEEPVLMSLDRQPMLYGQLWSLVDQFSTYLIEAGVKPGNTVAVIMPEGPEAFVVFLAVCQVAIVAPINSKLKSAELSEYLLRINPCLLITQTDDLNDVMETAGKLMIPVLEVKPDINQASGTLVWNVNNKPCLLTKPLLNSEIAILIFTSATTDHAKLVPLTHDQIFLMVESMRLILPDADKGRVLIITPHYHLQCLLSAFIQLFSGGGVIASTGLKGEDFEKYMLTFRPTSFSANSTMFKLILSQFEDNHSPLIFSSLRFVSSAGMILTDKFVDELEQLFGVPVINGYGLTEAGRVSMSPFKKEQRRKDSVGMCCGPEVAIMDEEGRLRPHFETAEVVLRGDTVIKAYLDEPAANISAFIKGWFHTGDLGYLDPDGFLYLVGRIKEIINRGGEKILPYEIENILQTHPAISEAAVFGYPHPSLGEDIGACIILRTPASAEDIRTYLVPKLAAYKIPRWIVFSDHIPKGETGKPQRSGLAEYFNLSAEKSMAKGDQKPSNAIESRIIAIWKDLLKIEEIGPEDDFFALGGDSLSDKLMLLIIKEEWDCEIRQESLLARATPSSIAHLILQNQQKKEGIIEKVSTSVRINILQPNEENPALFLFPLIDGSILVYRDFLRFFGRDIPVYGISFDGPFYEFNNSNLEKFATEAVKLILNVQANGPYFLSGYSGGGIFAYAVVRKLQLAGKEVGGLILIDTYSRIQKPGTIKLMWQRFQGHYSIVKTLSLKSSLNYLFITTKVNIHRSLANAFQKNDHSFEPQQMESNKVNQEPLNFENINWNLRLKKISVSTLLFWCKEDDPLQLRKKMLRTWRKLTSNRLDIHEMTATHNTVIYPPLVSKVAEITKKFILQLSNQKKND